MELQEKAPQTRHVDRSGPPAPDLPAADLGPVREEARDLAEAGLAAIDQFLSRDSQAFMAANWQLGGQ